MQKSALPSFSFFFFLFRNAASFFSFFVVAWCVIVYVHACVARACGCVCVSYPVVTDARTKEKLAVLVFAMMSQTRTPDE